MIGRAVAAVNLAAIERNSARLAGMAPALCAVVKADGYGHGAVPCARAALHGGATTLAVSTALEACALREAGLTAPIIVLGALTRAELAVVLRIAADVVVWSEELLADVAAIGGGARVHIKLDSGMGRLGTRDGALADRLAELAAAAPQIELVGAMTHLASADEVDGRFTGVQLGRFEEWVVPLRERHQGIVVHAENSAALLARGRARYDMARCGIALYGLDPFGIDGAARGLDPALTLRTWVASVKPCAVGESTGYGRRFIADQVTELAVLPIGYADGVNRALSGVADVLIDGARRRFAGTVSMDSLAVELGLGTGVEVGMEALLIGSMGDQRITVEELARHLDTINYAVTCGLSARVTREYHRDGRAP